MITRECQCLCTLLAMTVNTLGSTENNTSVICCRGQQTPCGNFTFLSTRHQRLKHNFGGMGSQPGLREECFKAQGGYLDLLQLCTTSTHVNCSCYGTLCKTPCIIIHYFMGNPTNASTITTLCQQQCNITKAQMGFIVLVLTSEDS